MKQEFTCLFIISSTNKVVIKLSTSFDVNPLVKVKDKNDKVKFHVKIKLDIKMKLTISLNDSSLVCLTLIEKHQRFLLEIILIHAKTN